jgi:predicted metal-dependent hydrolase
MDYQLKRSKRISGLKMEINQSGKLIVTAPYLLPEIMIKKMVNSKKDWILKNQEKAKKYQSQIAKDEVYIFDKKYRVKIDNQADNSEIKVWGDKLLVNNLSPKTTKQNQEKIDRFLKNTASKYLVKRTKVISQKMGINYGRVSIRQQKSRWGSCSSQGNLNFNWRLVHYPPKIIDYVIIHELAHRKELNHSKRFWDIVRKYDPEYPIHKSKLNKRRYN